MIVDPLTVWSEDKHVGHGDALLGLLLALLLGVPAEHDHPAAVRQREHAAAGTRGRRRPAHFQLLPLSGEYFSITVRETDTR